MAIFQNKFFTFRSLCFDLHSISLQTCTLLFFIQFKFFLGGFLLPGNNKIGTLKWKCRYYVFSSVDRAEQFGSEPDLYIQVKLSKITAEILFLLIMKTHRL